MSCSLSPSHLCTRPHRNSVAQDMLCFWKDTGKNALEKNVTYVEKEGASKYSVWLSGLLGGSNSLYTYWFCFALLISVKNVKILQQWLWIYFFLHSAGYCVLYIKAVLFGTAIFGVYSGLYSFLVPGLCYLYAVSSLSWSELGLFGI